LLNTLAKKPQGAVGAIDFAKTGRVTWKKDNEPTRIRVERISEKEALEQGVQMQGRPLFRPTQTRSKLR
jgi:hypothetical protein